LGDRAVCNEAAIAFFIQCAICAGAANRSNLRGILSFILLLLGSLFIGITVENPIVGEQHNDNNRSVTHDWILEVISL
jgi:hypothetical protein